MQSFTRLITFSHDRPYVRTFRSIHGPAHDDRSPYSKSRAVVVATRYLCVICFGDGLQASASRAVLRRGSSALTHRPHRVFCSVVSMRAGPCRHATCSVAIVATELCYW